MQRRYLTAVVVLAAIPATLMCAWSVYGNLTQFDHSLGFSLLMAVAGVPGLLGFLLPAAACAAWLFVGAPPSEGSRAGLASTVGVATLLLVGFAAPWSIHWALHHVYLPAIGPTTPPIPHGAASDIVRLITWAFDSRRDVEAGTLVASALRPVALAVAGSILALVGSFVAGRAPASRPDQAFVAFVVMVTYMFFFMPWLTRSAGILSEFLPILPATCILVTMLRYQRTARAA